MNKYPSHVNQYAEVAVQTSSPEKLVVLLYEGVIRFLRESVSAIEKREIERKRQAIDRAVAVIQHLQSTLDRERGGKIAAELDRLYAYVTSRIMEGSGKLTVAPIEEAIKLLTTLLSGWEEVARTEKEPVVPPALLTQQISGGRSQWHA